MSRRERSVRQKKKGSGHPAAILQHAAKGRGDFNWKKGRFKFKGEVAGGKEATKRGRSRPRRPTIPGPREIKKKRPLRALRLRTSIKNN